MKAVKSIPDPDKLSVIMVVIVLAFSLTRIIPISGNTIQVNLAGFIIRLDFGLGTLIAIITGLLSAAGSNWLIMSHPYASDGKIKWFMSVPHWIIPVFSSFVISITLNNMTRGNAWWIVLGLGSLLLMMVFIAEYNVVDPEDLNHPVAAVSLIALSFALFLILAISLRTAEVRLYIILPVLVIAGYLVALRTLYLRSGGKWLYEWVLIIALIIGQAVAGLYYLPLNPISFALFILALLYSMTSLFSGLHDKRERFALLFEPLSMFTLICLIGVVSG
jgi:hypothetical protein